MTETRTRTIPISKNGRMNLPADIRRALGLTGSGHLILTLEDDEVRITTTHHALKRIRELAAPYKPETGLVSDQLVAERRQEATREDDEIGKRSHG